MTRIAIAGGGIAGLAAAIGLAQSGEITVFERRPDAAETSAGLQLSPNATRLLRDMGLLPAIAARALAPDAIVMRRARDAREIARVPLGATALQRYGAPTLVLHRADLRQVLVDAALEQASVRLERDVGVVGFDDKTGDLTLSAQGQARATSYDGLIWANGVHAPAPDGSSPRFSGQWAWRALVPRSTLPPMFAAPNTNLWLGPDAHLVHYPLPQHDVVNVIVILAGQRSAIDDDSHFWRREGDPDTLRRALRGWHELPRTLLDQAPAWHVWPLLTRTKPVAGTETRETRVGDAFHPMLPFLAQGASQAIEDAAALAQAFAQSPTNVAHAFRRFERGRVMRVARVQQQSEAQGRIYHLDGPLATARDLTLGLLGPQRLLRRMDWLYANG